MEEGFDLGTLLQALAVFVFFVLPVLKSIAASKAKEREQQPPGKHPAPRRKGAGQKRGLEDWERLLRGELPERPAPPEPVSPPAAPVSQRDRRPMPEAGVAPTRPVPVPQVAASASPAPSLQEWGSERGHEGVAGGLGRDASFGERALEPAAAGPDGKDAEPARGPVGTGPHASSQVGAEFRSARGAPRVGSPRRAPRAGSGRPRPRAAAALGALDARGWRRALVQAELLSPPLALRDRPAWPGGPAIS